MHPSGRFLGANVCSVRTTFVPRDETIVHLFEAPGVDVLRRAAMLAELPFGRILEAVERRGQARPTGERRPGGAV